MIILEILPLNFIKQIHKTMLHQTYEFVESVCVCVVSYFVVYVHSLDIYKFIGPHIFYFQLFYTIDIQFLDKNTVNQL